MQADAGREGNRSPGEIERGGVDRYCCIGESVVSVRHYGDPART